MTENYDKLALGNKIVYGLVTKLSVGYNNMKWCQNDAYRWDVAKEPWLNYTECIIPYQSAQFAQVSVKFYCQKSVESSHMNHLSRT